MNGGVMLFSLVTIIESIAVVKLLVGVTSLSDLKKKPLLPIVKTPVYARLATCYEVVNKWTWVLCWFLFIRLLLLLLRADVLRPVLLSSYILSLLISSKVYWTISSFWTSTMQCIDSKKKYDENVVIRLDYVQTVSIHIVVICTCLLYGTLHVYQSG